MRKSGLRDPPAASHSCQQLPAQHTAAEASPGEPGRTPQSACSMWDSTPMHSSSSLLECGRDPELSIQGAEHSAGALRPGKMLIHLIAIAVISKSLFIGQVPHSTHPQRHFLTHWVGSPPVEKSSPERAGDGKGKGKEEGGNRGSNGPSRKP